LPGSGYFFNAAQFFWVSCLFINQLTEKQVQNFPPVSPRFLPMMGLNPAKGRLAGKAKRGNLLLPLLLNNLL